MLFAGIRLIYLGIDDMRSGGDESVSRSTICMGFPPVDGSSFEFLLFQSHSTSSHPHTPVFYLGSSTATPGLELRRLGVGSSSGAGGRPFRPI